MFRDSKYSTDILITNHVFRDHSSWHIVVAINTTDGTTDDRVKIYVWCYVRKYNKFYKSISKLWSFYRSRADNYVGVNNNSSIADNIWQK